MRKPYTPQLVTARPTARRGHFIIDRPLRLREDGEPMKGSHWQRATCREMSCPHYLKGWKSLVPEGGLAYYIRNQSGREFTEEAQAGGMVLFSFPPGQKCFSDHSDHQALGAYSRHGHYLPLDRQEIFVGNGREHVNPGDWTEHHNETLYQFQRVKERG